MTTKSEILDWYCKRCDWDCRDNPCSKDELSALIDSLVKSCPSEPRGDIKYGSDFDDGCVFGNNKHCDAVENWKKEVLG